MAKAIELTQEPLHFTVGIANPKSGATVGTGVVVSMDGKIVTCAHVVEAAGIDPRKGDGSELEVRFPQERVVPDKKKQRATVIAFFPQHEDDLVLLQLVSQTTPLGPEAIPELGKAEASKENPFSSYGFTPLGSYPAVFARGTILGCHPKPDDRPLQAGAVQLESSQIAPGMSGAGVLDQERNLVVGVVSETWFPDASTKHRDTAWAVNARVLSLKPLGLPLSDTAKPKRLAPQPKTDIEAARAQVAPKSREKLVNAPPPLKEWVGRVELLKQITTDWADERISITGLIGFGGEGKSSLARRWLEELRKDKAQPQPDGVFWWGFYEKPSVDEFFESALEYMGGGMVKPQDYPSASAKAHLLAAMLGKGRYLFVLDGLEVMQHQKGDQYGLLKSRDLRDFLRYFGASGHSSYCLITGRAPMLNLMSYTTYRQRDVTRLSEGDGCALLRALGVQGKDEALNKVVSDWDGHALTLGLIGSLVGERYGGDLTAAEIGEIKELPEPEEGQEKYKGVYSHVHRVLRRYDEHLTEAEQAFMTMFSAFRLPVKSESFKKVFRTTTEATSINAPVASLEGAEFDAMIQRLVQYRILRFDANERRYTAHPLVRKHYQAILTKKDQGQQADAHQRIKGYYLEIAEQPPRFPTLDDLAPWVEIVHHLCQAEAYDEAEEIRWNRVDQCNRKVVNLVLGANETQLAIIRQFFPEGDLSLTPLVSAPRDSSWILCEVGLCLMNIGRLREATRFYKRSIKIDLGQLDWANVSITHLNLAELHAHLGSLSDSGKAANQAFDLAKKAEDEFHQCVSLVKLAWTEHLKGNMDASAKAFGRAERLLRQIAPEQRYLYGMLGVYHADWLLRTCDPDQATRISEANLHLCSRHRVLPDVSLCHRVIGDLDGNTEYHDGAREHYDEALRGARSITRRDVLIQALLGRGRWWAKHMKKPDEAFSDLNEALEYTVDGEYRIFEADIRIALGWAHLAKGKDQPDNINAARAEVERAMQMSEEMGYYWGKVDGQELLDGLDG